MFDTSDPGWVAFLADVPEPIWDEHPVYAQAGSDTGPDAASGDWPARLLELLAVAPAQRPTAALAGVDPAGLPAGSRIDLLTVLAEQQRWLHAAQTRVLAAIDTADDSACPCPRKRCRWRSGSRCGPPKPSSRPPAP